MNGFNEKGLDEDAFGEKSNLSGLKTFDAFREFTAPFMQLSLFTPPAYTYTQVAQKRAENFNESLKLMNYLF